jgi:DNA segregation ATPase FtsK/SpoIIIE, S-DNA-T family
MNWRRTKKQLKAKLPKTKIVLPEFSGFVLIGVATLGFYSLLQPHASGDFGRMLVQTLTKSFGKFGSYFLWTLVGYRGLRLVFRREKRRPWRYVLVDAFLLAGICVFATSFGQVFLDGLNSGGYTGKALAQIFGQLFGRWGSLLISTFLVSALFLWRAGKRPMDLLNWIGNSIAADFREWRQAIAIRQERAKELPLPRKGLPKVLPKRDEDVKAKAAADESKARPPVLQNLPEKPIVSRFEKAPPKASQMDLPKPTVPRPAPQPAAVSTEGEGAAANEPLPPPPPPYDLPSLEMLTKPERAVRMASEDDLLAAAQHLEQTLAQFDVQGKVVEIHPGPIITRFDFTPAPGIKVQAVASLSNDIALAMKALSVRIVAPIPGKSAVGIELPNVDRAIVRLREVFESNAYQNSRSKLAIALGNDAEGHPYVADLAQMPHMLIAGATGAGKSVCIHSIVMSLLFKCAPHELKLLLIDPKRLELPLYNGIPHLYDPNQNPDNVRVITDPKEASKALEGMIKVMDHRFKKLASVMARDLAHYNEKMVAEGRPIEPYIVIIIDELADMMAVAPKEVEGSIQRLTQMARAVGIHMILATQRPSVDVITGVIKANLPARVAFRVASQTDSRVILDTMGAESLLGKGDLLFLPPGDPKPTRLQCGLITTKEVQVVSDFAKSQGSPAYERVFTPTGGSGQGPGGAPGGEELDDLQQALMLVLERRRVSQDLLKAHFGSSARATDLLSQLEVKGFINKPEGTNRWTIYYDRIDAYLGSMRSHVEAEVQR